MAVGPPAGSKGPGSPLLDVGAVLPAVAVSSSSAAEAERIRSGPSGAQLAAAVQPSF